MNKKNIQLLLCAPLGGVVGGIAKWTEHIINYYSNHDKKSGIEIHVYSTSRKNGVHTISNYLHRIYFGLVDYIPVIKDFNKIIRSGKYDIVHITSSASISLLKDIFLLKKAKSFNIKTIVHFHFGRIPEVYIKRNWEHKLLNKVIKLADKAVVIDQKSFDTLKNEGFSNIEFLPNPLAPRILDIIEEYKGIKKEKNKIVFAGNVVPTKGVFELVEACKDIPDIKVKMLGFVTDNVKNKLKEQAGVDNTWLDIAGGQSFETIIKEMLSASVFVLPTYTEGFPNVILESMACGCPIVASAVGAIPEMLDVNGDEKCGLCIEPKDIQQLKNAILKMLEDKEFALQCGKNAQKRVIENYSMPVVWDQLNSIWKSLLN